MLFPQILEHEYRFEKAGEVVSFKIDRGIGPSYKVHTNVLCPLFPPILSIQLNSPPSRVFFLHDDRSSIYVSTKKRGGGREGRKGIKLGWQQEQWQQQEKNESCCSVKIQALLTNLFHREKRKEISILRQITLNDLRRGLRSNHPGHYS